MNSPPSPQGDNAPRVNSTAIKPDRKPGRLRKYGPYLWIGGVVAMAALAFIVILLLKLSTREPYSGPTWTVTKQKLLVTIVERGSLESAENSDIIVRVKAGAKGSTSSSTIKWVIDDGSQVKAGDKIVDLDDSGFQDQLKTQKNTVNKAYSEWIQAKTDCTYQEIQNESDIKTAEVNLSLSQLGLKKYAGAVAAVALVKIETREELGKYLQGDFENAVRKESLLSDGKLTSSYLQEVSDLEGKIEMARSDKETWLDRASWSQRMVKKGFFSLSQADADQSRLASMEITLRKAQGDLDIYRHFDLETKITTSWSDFKEKERAVKRVKIQAESQMEKKKADDVAKKAILDQELDRLHDMEKEERYYKITSPQDGMVVYFVAEQSRGGSGSQQSIVAQGEPVREGQKLMRIPNLSKMMVNARVHEAMVSKLIGERTRPTAYGDILRYTFSLGRHDLFGMTTFHFAFDEVREKFKEKEQDILYKGQPAAIRVDAHPGKQYRGHVRTVATVASQAEFFSSDVKVYQTMVSIEDTVEENLKPGMSAEVTILADETPLPVLVVPIQAVIGNVAMGEKRKCFVLDDYGFPLERDIVVGKSSDKLVEITDGLEEGEKIVLNPRPLIPEKSDLKPGTPGTRRGADFEGGGGKKSGKKKGDGSKGDPSQRPDTPAFQRPDVISPGPGPANKKGF